MDYPKFVKQYYTYIWKKLNECQEYFGSFAMLNYVPQIPKEFLVMRDNDDNTFLPTFYLTADAPSKYIEEFLDFYAHSQPDLGIIYLGKQGLQDFYKTALENGISEDNQYDFITLVVDLNIEALKHESILR